MDVGDVLFQYCRLWSGPAPPHSKAPLTHSRSQVFLALLAKGIMTVENNRIRLCTNRQLNLISVHNLEKRKHVDSVAINMLL